MPRKARSSPKGGKANNKRVASQCESLKEENASNAWVASLLKTPKLNTTQEKATSDTKKRKVDPSSGPIDDEPDTSIVTTEPSAPGMSEPLTGYLSQYLVDDSWASELREEFEEDYFKELNNVLKKDFTKKTIFPPKEMIFNAFNMCPFDKIKVVILGQDPYHDDDQACGMAFGVKEGQPPPPSLKNIHKELSTDIDGFKTPDHGCLNKWAEEGVLLLNTTLTVEAHQPNSHKKYGWQKFTDTVISKISSNDKAVVFILWGAFAHKKAKLIDSKHSIIKTAHPSGCSYYLFRDCKCFSKANAELKKLGRDGVDWTLQ